MNKKERTILNIFIRYSVLILLGISLSLFYKILLPLTLWPVYFLLKIFYDVSVSGNILSVAGTKIELINACIAGSAYYLLLILNLTTNMKVKQRFYSIIFSFSSFLILNILRIFLLSILYIKNFVFFDITHKLFWYALSVLFVVGIWFLTIKLFKIKNIPVYSDVKALYSKRL